MGTVLRAAASSSSSRWTGVTSSSTLKKNKNNNAMMHHFRLKTNTTIITMRPRAASEDGDDGQVKWNTLESDGWVSEDPEPSPPPAGQVDEYERDARGRLSYVPRGFYYDAVRPDDEGDRLKVDVGVVGGKRQRTFVLRKILPSASDIVSVTYERPLGIVFERDTEGMVRVADFVEGSRAGKLRANNTRKRVALTTTLRCGRAAAVERLQAGGGGGDAAPKRGDVLRAFTTTTLSFGPRAQLLGDLSGTKRAVVLFGADQQPWNKTVGALKTGLVADGPVTLLLERERDEARANAWTPEELEQSPGSSAAAAVGGGGGQTSVTGVGGAQRGGNTGGGAPQQRERAVVDDTDVPDAINKAFLVSGISFILLILAGFSP